jgi:ferredoxin
MAEPAKDEQEKAAVSDQGIDVGVSRLTPEKIERVIDSVLKGETGARLKTYVETCIHCGLCSEACHYYLSHDKDPHYSPVGKVKQTIWEMLKKKGRVSPEFIRRPPSLPTPNATCASAAPNTAPSASISPI